MNGNLKWKQVTIAACTLRVLVESDYDKVYNVKAPIKIRIVF